MRPCGELKTKGKNKGMATYHCSVRVGKKGKAGPHASYISRDGKYKDLRSGEKLEVAESYNMPKWARNNPIQFWECADMHERVNGSTYREIEVALPRELTQSQRISLMREFTRSEFGDKHVFSFAIHNPKAAIDGGEQPHAHIMFSERILDGIDRDPEQFFKRFNAKVPAKGGCQKSSSAKKPNERKAELVELRERWATIVNKYLEKSGHEARVDHRSLKEQGIEREVERHLGPKQIKAIQQKGVIDLQEYRRTQAEKDQAEREAKKALKELVENGKQVAGSDIAISRYQDQPAQQEHNKNTTQHNEIQPLETVEQYVARKADETGRRFTVAQIGKRIIGTLEKIKQFAGQIYGIVDVGLGDRLLVRHDFHPSDIGKKLKGFQREHGFESDLDRAPKDRSRGLTR